MNAPHGGKAARWLLTLLGCILGLSFPRTVQDYFAYNQKPVPIYILVAIYAASTLIAGFVLFLTAPFLLRLGKKITFSVNNRLNTVPISDIVFGILGLLVGIIIAFFLSRLYQFITIPILPTALSVLTYILLPYVGVAIAVGRQQEFAVFTKLRGASPQAATSGAAKVMDTSVIIDGRIYDVLKTGFMEGPLIISEFMLTELRHIADSSDPLKRARGRRGLDILQKIQKELPVAVKLVDKDYDENLEVDVKLLKLAQELGGCVVTNDYNLNKVAEVAGVRVLNINDLSNAVKPVVLPNEEMHVNILREGKEPGQGVAYLNDGTMVVVENGKQHVGEDMDVIVTSVLQTSAGRMIFTKTR